MSTTNSDGEKAGANALLPLRVLAMDTSNTSCSCCLRDGGRTVASTFLSVGLKHSETFMPMVHEMMAHAAASYESLGIFACTVGPGSFTGIRIGVSATQAMAFAADKPAVPVSSLRALAYPLFDRKDTLAVAMIDARNARVFSAAYMNGAEVVPEGARPIGEFVALCETWRHANAPDARILTCGNASGMFPGAAKNQTQAYVTDMTDFHEIDPRVVATIGEETFLSIPEAERAEIFLPERLLPVYLARTAAERNLVRANEDRPAACDR